MSDRFAERFADWVLREAMLRTRDPGVLEDWAVLMPLPRQLLEEAVDELVYMLIEDDIGLAVRVRRLWREKLDAIEEQADSELDAMLRYMVGEESADVRAGLADEYIRALEEAER